MTMTILHWILVVALIYASLLATFVVWLTWDTRNDDPDEWLH